MPLVTEKMILDFWFSSTTCKFANFPIQRFIYFKSSFFLAVKRRKRDTSTCPPARYTSRDGLQFQTYCGQNIKGTNLSKHSSQNITSCMETCSLNRPRCYGVSFDSNGPTCYLKPDSATTGNLTTWKGWTSALANATQLASPANVSCPYPANSIQTTRSGLEFEVLCNLDRVGEGDYCPPSSVTCPSHADSLEECMDTCAKAHPLCQGVSWNVDMTEGFANCYLKNSLAGTPSSSVGVKTHSTIARFSSVDDTCPKNLTYISNNNKNFTISCWDGRTGTTNITTSHESDIDSCINTCATHQGGQTCVGVSFDNSMDNGFENCYLLNDTGSANEGMNATFAKLTNTADINLGGTSHHPWSKAWIAGPVIGIVLLIALSFLVFFWYRRRAWPNQPRPQAVAWQQELNQPRSPDQYNDPESVNGRTVEMPNNVAPQEKPANEEVAHLMPTRETTSGGSEARTGSRTVQSRECMRGDALHELPT